VAELCNCEGWEFVTDTLTHRNGSTETSNGARVSFPLGVELNARARFDLFWETVDQHPSPQVDILLQVLVDAAVHALKRCRSSLAPESESSYRSAPGVVIVPNSGGA
jgi:hypothetical protein